MDEYKLVIKPRSRNLLNDLKEIIRYKDLFYIFAWRDIKVRYKQTFLGVAWVILQPIITMFLFSFFFGKVAKIPSGNLPYPLFVLVGLVFWSFFTNALTQASNSMIDNENIIKKVYFPKIILPLSAVITGLLDFAINLVLLLAVTYFYGFIPSWSFIWVLPFGLLLSILTISGIGLFLSALNVKYRDIRYILPFFIQILLFVTPVIYSVSLVSSINKFFLAINPMTGVIESARSSIGSQPIDFQIISVSVFFSIIVFVLGLKYFRQTERFFADIV